MMDLNQSTECRMLQLSLDGEVTVDQLNEWAAELREEPEVLRVRVHVDARELEILYQPCAGNVLRVIHRTWWARTRDWTSAQLHRTPGRRERSNSLVAR